DLEPDLAPGEAAEPVGVDQRGPPLAQGHRLHLPREVQEVAIFLDDASPLAVGHSSPPSTRITEVTSRTMSIFCRASTVALSAASVAACETTTSWASSSRPS